MTAGPDGLRPEEWLGALVPLGVSPQENVWRPLGAGVLLIDPPVVWLITAAALLDAAGDTTLAAFVTSQGGGTGLDLTTGRRGTPLDWLRHERLDLAACLFPINPAWGIKAFPEARCLAAEQVTAGLPLQVAAYAYGTSELGPRPAPLLLPGQVARRDASSFLTTAPLLPHNLGAPLVTPFPGGGVALVGIQVRRVAVPDLTGPLPALHLSQALPISEGLALIRSEAGRAQRRLALELQPPQ